VRFGELCYAREARSSYADFLAARSARELPSNVRFQVDLPTPFAVTAVFTPGKDFLVIEEAYTKAMLRELETICAAIPHSDLCIQWDVCQEMIAWDGQSDIFTPDSIQDVEGELTKRMKRLCEAVPADVEMGVHLCYGDPEGKHIINPRDGAREVAFANAIVKAVKRPITYIHMPVPIDRFDDAFFAPLKDLNLGAAQLYLGLVHPDGAENMKRRLALASKHVTNFGIGTECGMSRARSRALALAMLQAHVDVSREPA